MKGPAPVLENWIVFEVAADMWKRPPSDSIALLVKKFVSITVTLAVVAEFGMYRTEADVLAVLELKVHLFKVTEAELFNELAIKIDAPRYPA